MARIFGVLSRWGKRWLRDRVAIRAAVRHLRDSTGQRAHPFDNRVIGDEARGVVVRVCYGWSKPPGRKWYIVGANGSVVAELTGEDVDRFGEPEWL